MNNNWDHFGFWGGHTKTWTLASLFSSNTYLPVTHLISGHNNNFGIVLLQHITLQHSSPFSLFNSIFLFLCLLLFVLISYEIIVIVTLTNLPNHKS
ncbi:hypothetical protein RIF29_28214 [Crotalaria pallida]|uniref:Uncharacterized protein n=1 Tax=Crotalaria pallida TaxID=3830 RepID=A0AAN9ESQ3_CROPI